MRAARKNRLHQRFGRLVVIGSINVRGLGIGWKCLCDCGTEIYAAGGNLDSGNTQSCGCLHRDNHRTHGKTKSRVYVIWKAMRRRCQNPKALEFKNYGGRGISVCERWQTFENFYEDMGDPPDGFSIERNDNDGNYEPSNCRWASYKEQLNNTRSNRFLEAFGKRQTLTQWSEELNIPVTTIRNRLDRAGLSVERALERNN